MNFDEPKGSEKESYSNDDLFSINSWGADLSFSELVTRYKDGDLLKPELQRKYVWSKKEASRFVDSVLLGLPVPSIFLAKEKNEKMLIIDGYQRIMTMHDYISGTFSHDGNLFKLVNSEIINQRWRNKSYLELSPEEQRKIKYTTIHAIIFQQKYPENNTAMYQIFERINASGRVLRPQEIRNCIYQGSFNKLLFELNEDVIWRKIFGSTQSDSRMYDLEIILRFFAIANIKNESEINQKQINLTNYLNCYMGRYKDMDPDIINKFRGKFILTTHKVFELFSYNSYKKYNKNKFGNKINPSVFDAVSAATLYAIEQNINPDVDNIEGKYINLLENDKFEESTSIRTTKIENIKTRINLATKYLYGVDYEWD